MRPNAPGSIRRTATRELEWQDPQTHQWLPAVYHDEIRAELLAEADRVAARHGGYVNQRAHGFEGQLDRTSFLLSQQSWGPEHHERPAVNFVIQQTAAYRGRQAGRWIRNGRVVIDRDSNIPLRDFPEIPATLSTEVEGWLMESIYRSNPVISIDLDLIPRIMHTGARNSRKRSRIPRTRLTMRCQRYRFSVGMIAWTTRPGRNQMVEEYKKIVGQAIWDSNDSRSYGDFSIPEQERLKRVNKGLKKRHGKRKADEMDDDDQMSSSPLSDEGSPEDIDQGASHRPDHSAAEQDLNEAWQNQPVRSSTRAQQHERPRQAPQTHQNLRAPLGTSTGNINPVRSMNGLPAGMGYPRVPYNSEVELEPDPILQLRANAAIEDLDADEDDSGFFSRIRGSNPLGYIPYPGQSPYPHRWRRSPRNGRNHQSRRHGGG